MSDELAWFKSSYSDSEGSACLEVAHSPHPTDAEATVHLRDSKLGVRSPRFAVPASAWAAFLGYVGRDGV
ncbi:MULTISPECIES: DUF397 domain-containing protein [Streptomyces]|uniref:DUF397 domain-containing protein n=1 Tax=Streptomyces griseoaurantiacus TaxID=68213 RepID=A0ABZ1V7E1_9ACTN|nr:MULTISPECIES: DUF397 domain-containing protein [Streptomyces]MDX3090886.1 DUF397 domain-containing protein [Streptomyces sp. ME12-02E]MDX3333287.1 DUF397 domain-containing protein [Streptomyces sp. ME02-6978a]MDX3363419.1 DUF397 domain-containing protein [Streptomyces sp. ME02-6978.2a]